MQNARGVFKPADAAYRRSQARHTRSAEAEFDCVDVSPAEHLVARVKCDAKDWTRDGLLQPWFRGHTKVEHELIPSILRGQNAEHEFGLTKKFRLMAPGYALTRETDRLDRWLFLMQHHNAPTRLLDWTESVLVAAFFAAEKAAAAPTVKHDAAIFALDPAALNKVSGVAPIPVTWTQNRVLQTMKFAFGTENAKVRDSRRRLIRYLDKPLAIYPSTIHSRIAAQRGRFTLHGSDRRSFESIFDKQPLITRGGLRKYRIARQNVPSLFRELSGMGISYASLFPDLDGLAKELRHGFEITDGRTGA